MANKTYQAPYETKGTQMNYGRTNKASCEASGGYWDEATQTCIPASLVKTEILNEMAPANVPREIKKSPMTYEDIKKLSKREGTPTEGYQVEKEAKQTTPEVIYDQETGKMSGVRFPDGKTFLGLSPKEIQSLISKEQEKTTLPEGTLPFGTAQAQAERQANIQRLTQLAQQGLLTPEEMQAIQGAEPSYAQAAEAGAIGILPATIGGAVGGATIGAIAGGGIGALPGAILGGIGGTITAFVMGAKNSLKGQQSQEFAKNKLALTKGQMYLRSLITDTNKYPEHAPENIAAFYKTLNMIDMAHARTFKDANEDLNKALGTDGFEKLAAFTVFDNTMRAYYINAFNAALTTPNPNMVLLTNEELGLETTGEENE